MADLFKKELERTKQNLLRDEVGIASKNLEIAAALYRSGNSGEAKNYFDESFTFYNALPADSLWKLRSNELVADCLFHQKRYAEAKPILENIVAIHAEHYPQNDEDVSKFKEMLGKTKANLNE